MSLLCYLCGAALLGVLVRWWRRGPEWRWIGAYGLFAAAFFAAPLISPLLQVPTDIAYVFRPWSAEVGPGFEPANPLLRDVPLQILPFRALVRQRLLRGEAPLWANEMGTGQPLAGNAQSAPFSPLGLLTLPLPAVRGLPVEGALKLFLALLLTDSLLAALGAGRAGAAFAAIAYGFSVFSICWAYHPQGFAMAWVPGVLLALVLLRRGERGGFAGLVACATGLALAGHPETLAHTALAAAGVACVLLVIRPAASRLPAGGACQQPARPSAPPAPSSPAAEAFSPDSRAASPPRAAPASPPSRARFLLLTAAACALSFCFAAPALLPAAEALGGSARATVASAQGEAVQPPDLAAVGPGVLRLLLQPLAWGSPRDGNWEGPSNFNELASGYGGLLALALAAASALTWGRRPLAILAGGAAAAAIAFGLQPALRLLTAIPPFGQAMNGRLRLFWLLAVAAAAGLGLDRLAGSRRARLLAAGCTGAAATAFALLRPAAAGLAREWWLVTLAGAIALFLALLWPGGHRSSRREAERMASARSLPPAGSMGADVPAATREATWLPWLAVACLALDLGLLNAGFLPVLPPRFDLSPPPPVPLLARQLAAAPSPFRVMAYDAGLMPNLSAFYGLWDPRSNDPMEPARASLLVALGTRPHRGGLGKLGGPRSPRNIVGAGASAGEPAPRYPIEFLGYLAVRYLFTPPGERLPPPWQETWQGASGSLWLNPLALPLFFMPAACRPAADARDALERTLERLAAPSTLAALATAIPAASNPFAAGCVIEEAGTTLPSRQQGTVRLDGVSANHFDLTVTSPTGGGVVSSVTFDRGWRLTVDGRESRPLRANAAFLGLLVPPGVHRVALDFSPAGWRWGLGLFSLALAACLVAGAVHFAPVLMYCVGH